MIRGANYNIIGKVIIILCLIFPFSLNACEKANDKNQDIAHEQETIIPGAHQLDKYLNKLKGKQVAMVVNQTSTIGKTHLVDTLKSLGVNIKTVFAPEHGFRGDSDAGATVKSGMDDKTGLPIISLYGKNKKPLPEQLQNIDIVIFDIQDVGTRFYTYISTMHYVMEACAEQGKQLLILDRPNPNGMYIDGPLLKMEHQSFVGMHPIPILHGLTVAELALMINGEKWLNKQLICTLEIIKVKNYSHDKSYSLATAPSPNLPNDLSIKLYPSLCLFEGTEISVGRGTNKPFQQIGHPSLTNFNYEFTPVSMEGFSSNPPYKDQKCYGLLLQADSIEGGLNLKHIIKIYEAFDNKSVFFNNFFIKLAGTDQLKQQITAGFTEKEIKLSWQGDLLSYKKMREQYLLYP
jgi:uncharacterized protein YbbC (DUF1343 family)